MADDQRHAFREAQHAKFAAMSDAEKLKFAAASGQMECLVRRREGQIQQDMAAFRASHRGRATTIRSGGGQ